MLPYLSLDSLVLGALCAPTLPRWRDRAAVALAACAADALGTWAALHAGPGVLAAACVALWAALTAALVGWHRSWMLPFWLGVAVLFGLDNLMLPVDDGALAAGLGSAVACVVGMAAVQLARRTAQRHWVRS